MSGPPPKPQIVKRSEGNPGKRRLKADVQPTPGVPNPPAWFDAAARRVWRLWIPELIAMEILATCDGPALEGACAAYSQAVQCRKRIAKKGLTMKVGNGYEQQRPEVAIEQKAWAQFRGFCAEFGLTPAARVRLAIEGGSAKDDELEALLAG